MVLICKLHQWEQVYGELFLKLNFKIIKIKFVI